MGKVTAKTKAILAQVAPHTPPPAPKAQRLGPTPEQQQKAAYERRSTKTRHGQANSIAYRRKPLFETLARQRSGIDLEGLKALRFYREAYELTAASLTRCALDVQERGTGVPQSLPPLMLSNQAVENCEVAVGGVVATLRAVALDDKSFSQVAIERFGSRKQDWLEQNKSRGRGRDGKALVFIEKIVPKSGRHREIIRREFLLAVERLTAAVRLQTSTERRPREPMPPVPANDAPPAPPPAAPGVDPDFLNEAGHLKPWSEIAEMIRERIAAA